MCMHIMNVNITQFIFIINKQVLIVYESDKLIVKLYS